MIKTFKQWESERKRVFADHNGDRESYEAGIQSAKEHYENEAIATMEYYDMILRKTNTKSIDDVPPSPQSEKEREIIRKLLAGEFK